MAINAGQVTLDEAATIDKRLQTVTRLITDTVHNEVMCIIDPDDADNNAFLRIDDIVPAVTAYGAFVRPINQNRTASGTLNALNAAVTVAADGSGVVNWEIDTGTLVGTVVFEATLDDTNWFAVDAIRIDGTIIVNTTTFADRGAFTSTGYSQVRLRVSAFTSGSSAARIEASLSANVVRLGDMLPAGTNNIGDVDIASPLGGGTEAAAVRVTLASDSTGLVSVDDNGASLTIDNAALSVVGGGVEASALRVTIANDSTGVLSVDDNAGSLTVDGTVTANQGTAAATGWEVVGEVADDAAAAGNPVLQGVIARNVDRTAVANLDASYALGDLLGKQIMLPYAVPELFVDGLATLTLTSDVAVIAAGAAGVRNYITSLSASNTSATAVRVDFKDGTTVKISFFVAASGGGAAQSFPVPIRGTAATAFNAALSAAVTDVRVSAQGYRAAN